MTTTVDTLLRAQVDDAAHRYAGISVGVLVGDVTVAYGAGRSGPQAAPPDARTLFQIGSVTKVVTALTLADLVTHGELTLDTPLADLLPDVPVHSSGTPITLAHLASHTAGLPRLPKGLLRQALRDQQDPYAAFTTADLLGALSATRLRRRPGTRWHYSNMGPALLGEALSRHAGQPYSELVTTRVLHPLGLTDTVITPRPEQASRRAVGHGPRRRPVPDWTLPAMPGAGALWSTVEDLLSLLRAHLQPQTTPLTAAVRLAQQPRATARHLQVGLGWHLTPIRHTPHTAIWHNGGTGGFASWAGYVPGTGVGLAVLANTARPVDPVALDLLPRLIRLAAAGPR